MFQFFQIDAAPLRLRHEQFHNQIVVKALVYVRSVAEPVERIRGRIRIRELDQFAGFEIKTSVGPGIAMKHVAILRARAPGFAETEPSPRIDTAQMIVKTIDV